MCRVRRRLSLNLSWLINCLTLDLSALRYNRLWHRQHGRLQSSYGNKGGNKRLKLLCHLLQIMLHFHKLTFNLWTAWKYSLLELCTSSLLYNLYLTRLLHSWTPYTTLHKLERILMIHGTSFSLKDASGGHLLFGLIPSKHDYNGNTRKIKETKIYF